jgi:phosphoenolpyruvate carboxylase
MTLPPRNPATLGPIRDMDTSSIYKRAENIIQHRTTVRQNDNHNNPAQIIETLTTETYQEIVKSIAAAQIIINKNDLGVSNRKVKKKRKKSTKTKPKTTIKDCVGYKVLEARSSPITFDDPGNISIQKKIL